MTNIYTKKSEDTWNTIAHSFNSTRRKAWHECLDFINSLPKNSIVADIGSGNGRHLIPCAKRCNMVIGIDVSEELLKIIKDKLYENNLKNIDLIHSDAVNIPIKSNYLDAVLFIATLHNIPERYRRQKSLKEINRILKPGGKTIISVWSRWQDKFRQHFIRQLLNRFDKNEFGDINIHWRQHGLNIPRYYHLYSKREFKNDLEQSGLKILKLEGVKYFSKKYYDNFYAIVEKK